MGVWDDNEGFGVTMGAWHDDEGFGVTILFIVILRSALLPRHSEEHILPIVILRSAFFPLSF